MTTPELPPLHKVEHAFNDHGDEYFRAFEALSVEARERILLARIAEQERLWQSAEARYAEADAAAMAHAKRIAEQDLALSIARQNAELLTGYWKAATAEAASMRNRLREAGLLEEDDNAGGW